MMAAESRMATNFEINSFLTKFKQLCSDGFNASLQFRSENGNAIVSFKVDLGKLCLPPISQPVRRRRSPAYYRRQDKRREARKEAGEAASKDNVIQDIDKTVEVREPSTASTSVTDTDAVEKHSSEIAAVEVVPIELKPTTEDNAEKAMVKSVGEIGAVQAAKDQTQERVAEKLSDKRKWLCLSHGCLGEDLDIVMKTYSGECDCCGDQCTVVAYNSEEEYEPP